MAVNAEESSTIQKQSQDSDEEDDFLEYSPCGVIIKLRQQVKQQAVSGIDTSFLAMDTDNGVEVVWNEVRFSENKNFKKYMAKISAIFDSLQRIEHPNIVRFHKYWFDNPDKDRSDKPRLNFITEYMSSGSVKHFLKRTRASKKMPLESWKRWCRQVLWALSYLHSSSPPIIHGNLTCDSMFIQHNGLLKIGSAAPDVIHEHVKTVRHAQFLKNIHFIAPEEVTRTLGDERTTKSDIYSFGMCALVIAALEIHGNGDACTQVTQENVDITIDSLEHGVQKDFIRACLRPEPEQRPDARQLLFHRALFEVPSLRLLAAHAVVNNPNITPEDAEVYCNQSADMVIAQVCHPEQCPTVLRYQDLTFTENVAKFVEDVRVGIYPVTVYAMPSPLGAPAQQPRSSSPDTIESTRSAGTPEPHGGERETRKVVTMMCEVKCNPVPEQELALVIFLRLDDKTNRQLSCQLNLNGADTGAELTDELIRYGLVNEANRDELTRLIDSKLTSCREQHASESAAVQSPLAEPVSSPTALVSS